MYSAAQRAELERFFAENQYPTYQERETLAAGLGLQEHQVQVRRAPGLASRATRAALAPPPPRPPALSRGWGDRGQRGAVPPGVPPLVRGPPGPIRGWTPSPLQPCRLQAANTIRSRRTPLGLPKPRPQGLCEPGTVSGTPLPSSWVSQPRPSCLLHLPGGLRSPGASHCVWGPRETWGSRPSQLSSLASGQKWVLQTPPPLMLSSCPLSFSGVVQEPAGQTLQAAGTAQVSRPGSRRCAPEPQSLRPCACRCGPCVPGGLHIPWELCVPWGLHVPRGPRFLQPPCTQPPRSRPRSRVQHLQLQPGLVGA